MPEALKDLLFNEETVTVIATEIFDADHSFNKTLFIKDCVSSFKNKELKERMTVVTNYLHKYLPYDYINNVLLMEKAFKNAHEGMFIYGSVQEYIETYGCLDEYVDFSLDYIGRFTQLLSGEFSIRTFLNKYPKKSLQKIQDWSLSENHHQRRLASEGVRPKLPWAKNINIDYKEGAKSLNNLYYDTERYVTRSVANHLNDISKIDPLFVLETLQKWKRSNKQNKDEMNYIIKHSLRTLIKKGHPKTMEFLGYKINPNVTIDNFKLQDKLTVGETLNFSFDLSSKEDTKLLIDYIITYQTKLSKPTTKTYKMTVLDIRKEETKNIVGKRSFKPISTRKFYEGIHSISIQINGEVYIKKDFYLQT